MRPWPRMSHHLRRGKHLIGWRRCTHGWQPSGKPQKSWRRGTVTRHGIGSHAGIGSGGLAGVRAAGCHTDRTLRAGRRVKWLRTRHLAAPTVTGCLFRCAEPQVENATFMLVPPFGFADGKHPTIDRDWVIAMKGWL